MIHPYFSSVPDQYIAEALSESLELGGHEYLASLEGTGFTNEDCFPPEPSVLTTITASFITEDGQNVRRLIAALNEEFKPTDEAIIEAYRETVVNVQTEAKRLELVAHHLGMHEAHPEYGRLGQWCVGVTQQSGKRLVAAHLVFVAPESRRLYDALVYPTAVRERFPLILRHAVEGIELDNGQESSDMPESTKSDLQSFMRNAKDIQTVAAQPPSTVMSSVEEVEARLRTM